MKVIFKKIWQKLKVRRRVTALLASLHFYGNPSSKLKIIGVTGTNGKTTTATLLYKIASGLGHKSGLIGTVENRIYGEIRPATHTTPGPVALNKLLKEMVSAGCEYVFMEVSSHALDQGRVNGIRFAGAVFTNLTHDHLDYHKNFNNYFNAKKKLFKMLPSDAFALTNIDDEYGAKMLEGIKAQKYTYALKQKADFNNKLETQLLGDFNAYNVLAVYATAELLDFDKEKPARPDGSSGGVKEILKNVTPPAGRFEHFTSASGVIGVVDFAHTPDALQNVITTARNILAEVGLSQGGRIISVFGCSGDKDPFKRPKMGKIGASLSDIAIFTSDNPRSEEPEKILEQMKPELTEEELGKITIIVDRDEAIIQAGKLAQSGDIVLLMGKGHESYQEIKGVKYPWNEMEKLKRALS